MISLRNIYNIFSRKKGGVEKIKVPMTLTRVWKIEFLSITLFFILVLAADVIIYQQFVTHEVTPDYQQRGMLELNKDALKRVGDVLNAHENYFKNAEMRVIANPF